MEDLGGWRLVWWWLNSHSLCRVEHLVTPPKLGLAKLGAAVAVGVEDCWWWLMVLLEALH